MAGASDTSEISKSILTAVEKCTKCPVCLETVKFPVQPCSSGHDVCLSCTTNIRKCPTCEESLILESPGCLRNIMKAQPRSCNYSQDGCEEMVKPGNDHEEFCGYRPIVCRMLTCTVEMPVVKVLDHYKEHHENVDIITERSVEGLSFLNLPMYTPVWLFDNLFWILIAWDEATDNYKTYFLTTPIGKPNHDYYVRVTVENGDFNVTNTLIAAVSSCEKELTRYDVLKTEIRLSDEYEKSCMKIPCWQIDNWISKTEKNAEIKLFIFRTANE